jgi:hypothetical protein
MDDVEGAVTPRISFPTPPPFWIVIVIVIEFKALVC